MVVAESRNGGCALFLISTQERWQKDDVCTGVVFLLLRSHGVYFALITLVLFSPSCRLALDHYVAKQLLGSQTERALLP